MGDGCLGENPQVVAFTVSDLCAGVLARAVQGQDERIVEGAREIGAVGVTEMVWNVLDGRQLAAIAGRAQSEASLLQQAPGRVLQEVQQHRQDVGVARLSSIRCAAAVGAGCAPPVLQELPRDGSQHPVGVLLRVPCKSDPIDFAQIDAHLLEARHRRAPGKHSVRSLEAREALFLSEGDQLPVAQDASAGVHAEGEDAEDDHWRGRGGRRTPWAWPGPIPERA